jgi:alpha-tubulin suppressor-like RCC1 family protein
MKLNSIGRHPFILVSVILLIGVAFILAPKVSHAFQRSGGKGQNHPSNINTQIVTKVHQHNQQDIGDTDNYTQLSAWGYNNQGQLGFGVFATTPQTIFASSQNKQPLTVVKQAVVGDDFACALTYNAQVECWGQNQYGQLGDGTSAPHYDPALVHGVNGQSTLNNVIAIAGAGHFMCALLQYQPNSLQTNVACWGRGDSGQLGTGSTSQSNTPQVISNGDTRDIAHPDYLYIAASADHVCGLIKSGHILCWGSNLKGQFGAGIAKDTYRYQTMTNIPIPSPPMPVPGLAMLNLPLALGNGFTCERNQALQMQCFGALQSSAAGVSMIAAGGNQACDLIPGQGVRCRSTDNTNTVLIPNTADALVISVANDHACSLAPNGVTQCWGDNSHGQLGSYNNAFAPSNTPITVDGLQGVKVQSFVSAPESYNSGVILKNGTMRLWGGNYGGKFYPVKSQTHKPDVVGQIYNPAQQGWGAFEMAQQVAVGANFSCAIVSEPDKMTPVECWGNNKYGGLGDGTNMSSSLPVKVKGIQHALSIAVGDEHACAVIKADDGTTPIVCWGNNDKGQLGNGTNTSSNVPVTVTPTDGQNHFTQVTANSGYTCALSNPSNGNDNAYCWGDNSTDQLGDDNSVVKQRNVPKPTAGGKIFTQISAGTKHVCAIADAIEDKQSNAFCWGDNSQMELGNHPFPGTPDFDPQTVMGSSDHYTAIASGNLYTCGLVSASKNATNVKCWGANNSGVIGVADSDMSKQYTPTFIHDDTKAIALAAYDHHACILAADSTVKCWGDNKYGQIAQDPSSTPNVNVPTVVSNLPKYVTSLATGGTSSSTIVIVGDKPPKPPTPTKPESISWADSANAIVAPNGVSSDNAIHGATLDASAAIANPQSGDALTYACSIHTPAPAHAAVANTTCTIPSTGAVRPITISGTGLNPANGYAIYVSATVTRNGVTVPDAQVHWIRLYKEIPAATASESINWPTADADISVPSTYSGTSLTGSLTANAILLKPQDGDQLVYSCGVYDGSMKPVAGATCKVAASNSTQHEVDVNQIPSTATDLTIHFSATVSRDGKTVDPTIIPWVKVDKSTQRSS